MEINADPDDLKILFKNLDRNKDNCLNFSEFSEIFIPKNIEFSEILKKRISKDLEIQDESRNLVVDLFRILIDNETRLEKIKCILIKKQGFNISEIYESLKGKIKCFVIKQDVNKKI